jgi:hypothetical protein
VRPHAWKNIYLEVPVVTQGLLNMKCTLRSSLAGLVSQKMKVTEQPHNLLQRLQLVNIGRDLPDERSQKNDLIQFVAVASPSRDNFVSLCCAFDVCGMALLSPNTSQTQESGRHMYPGDFVAQRSSERLHRRIQASFGG